MALSNEYKNAKNVKGANVFVDLITFSSPDGNTVMRFAKNNEPITYMGNTYEPIWASIGNRQETLQGAVPNTALQVSNVKDLQTGLNVEAILNQDENFGSLWNVEFVTVLTSQLSQESQLKSKWQVGSVSANEETVTFNLKIENPLRIKVPKQSYSNGFCQRTFDDGEGCPYSGQSQTPFILHAGEIPASDTYSFANGEEGVFTASSTATWIPFVQPTEGGEIRNPYRAYGVGESRGWASQGIANSKVNVGEFWQVKFSKPKVLYKLTLSKLLVNSADNNVVTSTPKNFKLEGSVDGQNWNLIHQYNLVNEWTLNEDNFGITNVSYTYFRLRFDDLTDFNTSRSEEPTAIGIRISQIWAINQLGHTSCGLTMGDCAERFSAGRTNANGDIIGLPILIFPNSGGSAIHV